MKKTFFLSALLSLFFVACQKDDDIIISSGEVTLKIGQTYQLWDGIKIKIEDISEGRCPTGNDVACIWQGHTVMKIIISEENNIDHSVRLTELPAGGLEKSVRVNGKKYEILEVSPYPNSNEIIPQKDYRIKMNIK